ncbi:ubiquitin-conjugating enzyme E2 S [Gorgonomyces haynaldii]|nr:ubiquitin-conjugating enzyme E2 S [Gorgonomyces haynaldii]
MRLRQSPPEGIQVVFNEDNVLDIQAVLHGPMGTPYEKGQFRIRLVLGSDFPQQPPKGQFLTTIFHPNVSSQGEICVSTLKKDWKPDVGIEQLLLVLELK